MLKISIIIGKTTLGLLRLVGRRGSALPGYIIEKLDKSFLPQTLAKLPRGVVIVTGTNGKTTTTKIITNLLESQGLRVLTNETGSNFVRGIVSTVLDKIESNGELAYDIAIFEQDEAYAARFVKQVSPVGLVALNVMRDQMDRFGEIDVTAKLISQAATATTSWLVLNANDPRIAAIAKDANKTVTWFGHSADLASQFLNDDQHHSQNQAPFVEAAKPTALLKGLKGEQISIELEGEEYSFKTQLEGTHNALNVTAALAAFSVINPAFSKNELVKSLATIQPAFGRGEQIALPNGQKLHLQLVKNPSGFTHSLRSLETTKFDLIAIAINDNFADGRDVSWLWDVNFESVSKHGAEVVCGGVRGYDMANRLKYEGAKVSRVLTDERQFLNYVISQSSSARNVIIFCTYTAMLKLRKLLKQKNVNMTEVGL